MELTDLLKVLADDTRLRILNVLRNGDLCVCEIQYALNASQSNISRHLSKLHSVGLVGSSKKAQWVSYWINPIAMGKYPFVGNLLDKELDSAPVFKTDLQRLSECKTRGIPCEWEAPSDQDASQA